MTQVTPQALIDPMNPRIPLTMMIENETQLFDLLWQMSLSDDDNKFIFSSPTVWTVCRGFILTKIDLKKKRKDNPYLQGWLYKDLYMRLKDWERQGTPSLPRHIEYCSMMGQDLENEQQAWEETSKFYAI